MVRWISFSLLVLLLTACAGNEEAENTSPPLESPSIHQEEQTPNPNPSDEEKDTVVGDINGIEENGTESGEVRVLYPDDPAVYEDTIRVDPKERVGKLEIDSIVMVEEIQPGQKETIMKYLTATRDEDIDSIEKLIHPESDNPEFITSGLQNKIIQAVKELTIDHHRSALLEEERGEGMATAVVAHLEAADGSLGGTASLVLFKKDEKWLIYRVD
ncbi:hypothetical protein PA598K_05264 [Paenibacillus sp. 598K]|uniref:hypothetical protein n=1 Tax=Paenibacillus sp. 598K TaxID=1117987 RepID=UPI000FFA1992|nr:hypothetical protein [Paenibacillus sp. 598K]GBF76777.1 hypothetical protein PA598K_05264 [Paenibacillus sp. 598K]